MRLHRLQVNAFGPFAGEESVDFDQLSEAGLFLLHGPTGAGKSSVLDAVCFALYGRVPGPRGATRPHLVSDHATSGTRPQVVLELTLAGRRLEVTRSPEWVRPKRRGAGVTTEKASAVLRERRGGQWVAVSESAQEVGHELQELLGMRLDQFTTVMMLPQGEFEAFLRADADARRALLEQLFTTERFSAVEVWLAGRRRELGRAIADVRVQSAELRARADEHAAQLPPAGHDDETPDTPVDLATLAERATTIAADAAERAVRAAAEDEQAQDALTKARDLAAHHARVTRLSRQQAQLAEGADGQRDRRARLDAARRAAPLMPHLTATARLQQQVERADAALAQARLAVPVALAQAGPDTWERTGAELAKELGRLEDARELADTLAEQERLAARATAEAEAATLAAQASSGQGTLAGARRVELQARLEEHVRIAGGRTAAETALSELDRIKQAHVERVEVAAELAKAQQVVVDRQVAANAAKATWLDLRERRLSGMAAELAAGLVEGQPCAVCGAREHPSPAMAAPDRVDAADEQQAQNLTYEADQGLASARAHALALAAALTTVDERIGGRTPAQVKADRRLAKAAVARVDEAAGAIEPTRRDLAAIEGQLQEYAELAAAHRQTAAEQRARADEMAKSAARVRTRIAQLVGTDGDATVRLAQVRGDQDALAALIAAQREQDQLLTGLVEAVRESEAACRAADFADLGQAANAALPADELAALAREVTAYDELAASVREQLEEPALADAATLPPPDVLALEAQARIAGAARRSVEQEHARSEQARAALTRLAAQLADHEAAHAGDLAEFELVDGLARCVEGSGGDNVLRMRLSSYVLAARLEQVAAAASERLLAMTDGRYTLVHSDALARGGVRSGLGLRVVDGWTGIDRETATLSGGESFLASLALALGLADAVQAEAGGATMETLFIDEGFGMLDAEALEEVLVVLDGLRDGGRAVGVVSHVAEVRDRIPARLEVSKSRTGSHLLVETPGAA